ncbi:MAG TPA: hypothetical protein VFW64_01155 [Pseudonocardiaceae bacterium]|nr:hypothetical protein [Pseudonocardiaceae bacterium]
MGELQITLLTVVPEITMSLLASTRPNTHGLACHVVDDLIERIAADHPLLDGGCLLGKGAH